MGAAAFVNNGSSPSRGHVCIVRPPDADGTARAILSMHGGWVLGNADTHDPDFMMLNAQQNTPAARAAVRPGNLDLRDALHIA